MIRSLHYIGHASRYILERALHINRRPFIGGLVVNDRCNLNCQQCKVGRKDGHDASADQLFDAMRQFRQLAIRSIFFVGGEPTIWKDGGLRLEDLIVRSKQMGFLVTTVYTNGTTPVNTSADTVFVSLDGLRDSNSRLRGGTFDRILDNITSSRHSNIMINTTINRQNKDELEALVEFVDTLPNIRGQYFYFHTPYYGFDDLYLSLDEKRPIIKRLLALKSKGYRILNSTACLETVYRDDWKRPSDLCCVWHQGKLVPCCRAKGNDELCKHCGYMGYPELQMILSLHPSALKEALRAYLPRRRTRKELQ
jgi:MoaA/NifB/PqqE/SkfB family radical SAM enzyme